MPGRIIKTAMSQKYLIRIAELESQLRQKDQQLSLVEETKTFLRSALARAEEKIEEDEREIEHLRAQIEKLRRMLFGTRSEKLRREVELAEALLKQREQDSVWLTPVQLIEEHCQLRAGNGYLAVTYRRPDKLAFLQAFGEQAQTISISPKNFDGVTPSATEDKQVTGEGIIIQHMLYLFSQSVEGFTHIGNAGNEPDTGT